MRNALQGFAISQLEDLANRTLSLDPAATAKLASLDGCSFALCLQDPAMVVVIGVSGQRLRLLDTDQEKVTTRLTGTWTDFAAVATADDPGSALINGNVTVSGDTQALLALRKILAGLDLDWEQPLADAFGDVIGHQIGRGLRSGQAWVKNSGRNINRQLEEFLREESRLMPHPVESRQFFDDIDRLRSEADRLEAKIRRLQQRAAARQP
ncbi:SCP2 sterol-binding domain-containing protein [Spongiibacter taiwanensis]|uniref:ubiquinone biosynthesis accessory factor UbiJ n=1 Tax=Spongiibacter taiwanensis TaxID=1748242 RepID=UPI002035126D|nr:SCP2 sterol-binding domain-containing protein [Spongiibacter taiwanensis]USA42463.1 SCP2 sterol-binding domain-containing protein [Spongiibacter taiwanensis]